MAGREDAVREWVKALKDGTIREQQSALTLLGEDFEPRRGIALNDTMNDLLQKKVTPEIQLDLLEAAARNPYPELKIAVARFDGSRLKGDALAAVRETLAGGDAEAGKRIFQGKSEVYCVRCHKLNGQGGEVGPELAGIGAKQNREYLLEALVDPNRQIAKGFDATVVALKSGRLRSGIVRDEDDKQIHLRTAELLTAIPKEQVRRRQ